MYFKNSKTSVYCQQQSPCDVYNLSLLWAALKHLGHLGEVIKSIFVKLQSADL